MFVLYAIRSTLSAIRDDTRKKPSFGNQGKQGKVLNLGYLDFDIVSDFDIRISDFAGLGIFTTVESALQIRPFMQNKANFRKSQMNVNKVLTKDYENKSNWAICENKPNTKPKQTQSRYSILVDA